MSAETKNNQENPNIIIQSEVSDDLEATLSVEVKEPELEKKYAAANKEFLKMASIPGFRRGKAPMSLALKKYAKEYHDFLVDKTDDFIRDYAVEAIESSNLKPAGQIDLKPIESEQGKPLKFEIRFPIQPEVELRKYKGLPLVKNTAEITETDIDNEIEALRRRHAMLRSIDGPASSDSKLKLSVQEIDPSGLQLIGKKPEEIDFEFGVDLLGPGTDEQIFGSKVGDKIHIEVDETEKLSGEESQSKIITPDKASKQLEGSDNISHYSVEVVGIEKPELSEIDEELAKKVHENLNSVEELRKYIDIQLLSIVAYSSRKQMTETIAVKVIEENNFKLSSKLIDSILQDAMEDEKIDEEEKRKYMEENRKKIENELKWMLLRDRIAKAESLRVEKSDIDKEMKLISEQTGKSMKEIKRYYSDETNRNRLTESILNRKVVDFLLEHAEIEERKMSLDEFAEMSRLLG